MGAKPGPFPPGYCVFLYPIKICGHGQPWGVWPYSVILRAYKNFKVPHLSKLKMKEKANNKVKYNPQLELPGEGELVNRPTWGYLKG